MKEKFLQALQIMHTLLQVTVISSVEKTCLVELAGFSSVSLRTQGISVKSGLQTNHECTFCMIASLQFIPIYFQTMYKTKLRKVWVWGATEIVGCIIRISYRIAGAIELQQYWVRMGITEQSSANMAPWKLLTLQVFLLLQWLAENRQNDKERTIMSTSL